MAFAALLSLEQTIDHILNCDIYSFNPHEKSSIISMNTNIASLREFLGEFPEKVNNTLEGQIRDVAHDAEDVIENFSLSRMHSLYIKWIAKVKFRFQFPKVAMRIDSIVGKVDLMKEVCLGNHDANVVTSSLILPPFLKKEAMVGFNDDLMAIKERLCGEPSRFTVIPIVGMGGIGKTTLAANAYNDPLITENFHIRAWVTISQDYVAQDIFSRLLASISPERPGGSNESTTVESVYKSLKGKRYLIVLDDMWSTKAWDDVRMIFPDDDNGSRIILTTRLTNVASYPDSYSHLHEMDLLGEDQSWNLLRQKVFQEEEENCPIELKIIGKEIAKSCGGLPLAVVVIAGLLSEVSKDRSSWERIAKNVKSAIVNKQDGKFEEMLSLSYNHLPHHLRPCFLYMGAFPEDYEIIVQELIKLWVAEGFIDSSNACRSLEEVAEEEYLGDLVKRSLVMVANRNSVDKIKSCRVHDLMREFCIRKSHQEKFLIHVMDGQVPRKGIKNQRRIVVNRSHDLKCLANKYCSTIRTVMCFPVNHLGPYKDLGDFRFLKIICFGAPSINMFGYRSTVTLPDQVFELSNLRYLGLPYPIEIPTTITNLRNLQTLIIHPLKAGMLLPCIQPLPREIWRMRELRHLVCYRFGNLPNPQEDGASTSCGLLNLHTLWEVTDLICTQDILKMISNVKELSICYFNHNQEKEYHLDNLVHLEKLERLKLSIYYSWSSMRWRKITPIFPNTLKSLTIRGGRRPWSKMRIVGSLPNLQVLKIKKWAFDGETWETSDDEFLELKHLVVESSNLEFWVSESNHFPKLKRLQLHQCLHLREISDGIGEIPTLELIEVKWGLKSTAEWAKRMLREQQNYGNDIIKVYCIGCRFHN